MFGNTCSLAIECIPCSISLINSIVIPELILHKLSHVTFDLNHDMHLLIREFKVSEELVWSVWECETTLKVNIVQPFLHVVHEESE